MNEWMTRGPQWAGHLECVPPTERSHKTNHRLSLALTASAHTVVILFYVNLLPNFKMEKFHFKTWISGFS